MYRNLVWGILLTTTLGAASILAQDADGRRDAVFPIVLTGGAGADRRFEATLHLMNLSSTTSQVEVVAFRNGAPDAIIDADAGPLPVKIIALEPEEAIRLPLVRPMRDRLAGFRESWVGVRVVEGSVNAGVRLTDLNVDSRGLVRSASDIFAEGARPARRFKAFAAWTAFDDCYPEVQSAYAFVNPSRSETAHVTLSFLLHTERGADRLFESELEIPPLDRIPMLLSQLFEGLFPPPGSLALCTEDSRRGAGVVNVSSDVPTAVSALNVNLRTGHFVDLPVQALPANAPAER